MFRTSDETLYFPQDERKYFTNQFCRVGDVFTVNHTADSEMRGNKGDASGSSFDIVVLSVIQPDVSVNTNLNYPYEGGKDTGLRNRVTEWTPYNDPSSVLYNRRDIFWEDEYDSEQAVHRTLDTYGWGTLWGHDTIDGITKTDVSTEGGNKFVTNGYRNPQNDKTLCGYPIKLP